MKRQRREIELVAAVLGMGIAVSQPRSRFELVERTLPVGQATEDERQIRTPKVGKRTKRWRAKRVTKKGSKT